MNLTCLKSGIWQVELRIPSDVRVVLGRTRFAKSTGTRDKRKASNKALPILTEWQQLITTARQNPELIKPKPNRAICLPDAAQEVIGNWHGLAWLDQLKPSQAKLYDAIEWARECLCQPICLSSSKRITRGTEHNWRRDDTFSKQHSLSTRLRILIV